MPQSEVLTLPEVARLLKVHPNTVYRMARRDGILRAEQGRSPPLGPSASPVAVGTAAQALRPAG